MARRLRNEFSKRCHVVKEGAHPMRGLCGYRALGSDKLVNGLGQDGEGLLCGACMRVERVLRHGYKRYGKRRGAGRGR